MNPKQADFSSPILSPRRGISSQPALGVPMPREHGAWGILAVSFVLGLLVAQAASWASLLVALAGLAAILGRRPALVALRGAGGRPRELAAAACLFGTAVALAAALVALRPDLWPVLATIGALFAADLALLLRGAGRTLWGEVPGIAGLALVAALSHASAAPELDARSAALGLVTALYFLGSIPYVRGYVRAASAARRGERAPREAAATAAIYFLAALNLLGMLAAVGWVPLLSAVALVPAALKAVWLAFGRARLDWHIRKIGFFEVAHSIAFAALTWLVFRVS